MSLLSAHHVSRANALIHSAYLSSICLHYNHAGITGFPPRVQIGAFISESRSMRGSTSSCLLHLKHIHRKAARGRATPTTSSRHCTLGKQKQLLSSTRRSYQEHEEEEGRKGLHCQTGSASNQIILHCCVKFQMTSKDVFLFCWSDEGG